MIGSIFVLCGCSFVAPATIPPVAGEFNRTAVDGSMDRGHVARAERCGNRLTSHRSAALNSYYIQTTFAVAGAIFAGGGGGGGLTAALSSSGDTQQIGGYVALIGGILSVLSNAISLALTDPSERLALRARAMPFYNRALSLAYELGDGSVSDAETRRSLGRQLTEALQACIDDGVATAGTTQRLVF